MDLQYGKSIAVFGKPGSGKSYLAGVLTETMSTPCPGLNHFPRQPSAVVIFNFRQETNARFEYASYVRANSNPEAVRLLDEEYGLAPRAIPQEQLLVCAHGTMIRHRRDTDYAGLPCRQLRFTPSTLGADDWMLLMGLPNNDSLYVQIIKGLMEDLYDNDRLTLANVESAIDDDPDLSTQQRKLARNRLRLAKRYLSDSEGLSWPDIVKPGHITVLDFRKEFLAPQDALRLALISLRGVGGVDRTIPKFVLFDEFHEYYDESFSDDMDKYTRMVRHQSLTLCIASQNTEKIDRRILQSFTNKFVFNVEASSWNRLCEADPALAQDVSFEDVASLPRETGECFVKFDECSVARYANKAKKMRVRPRLTEHGGGTVM